METAEAGSTETAALGPSDWQDRYLRLAAELENRKKSLARRYADEARKTSERLLLDLLPFVDNLERALEHAPRGHADPALHSGVSLSIKGFLDTLEKHGVEPLDALGESFDPELHEAIGAVPHPTLPSGTIVRVEQNGYLYDGRLLRPARVLVAS